MSKVHSIFAILVIFISSFSLPILTVDFEKPKSITEEPNNRSRSMSDLPSHAPILISSNEDFGLQGWPGSGSVENPYVIEGFSIESNGYGIKIEGVNANFIIRNCSVICDTIYFLNAGIVFLNSANGTISNCTIRDSTFGILIRNSENFGVSSNHFENNTDVIRVWDNSENIQIVNNTFLENSSDSIQCQSSSSIVISENIFANCSGLGGIVVGDDLLLENNYYNSVATNYWEILEVSTFTNVIIRNNTLDGVALRALVVSWTSVCLIEENGIQCADSSVTLYSVIDCIVANNNLTSEGNIGLRIEASSRLEIYSNIMDYLQIGSSTIDEWSIIVDENIVMGGELGVFKDIESETINTNSYSQLFILNCSNVVITSVKCPTAVSRSNEIQIQNIEVENLEFTPILISKSNNIDIIDSVAQNINDYVISIRDSALCRIFNFDFIFSGGIISHTSSDISVMNSSFAQPYGYAISLNAQYGGIIKFNEFIGGDTAIFCESSADVEFLENAFTDTSIMNYYSRNITISRNSFTDSINPGILLYEVTESFIESNQITNCSTGIHLFSCDELVIRGNTLRNNDDYGIFCFNIRYVEIVANFMYYNERGIILDTSSIHNMIYLNEIGFSNDVNAIDEGFHNSWDDEVCFGNFWSDYDETGVYEVDGAANSVDNYPNLLEQDGIRVPVINSPPDFSYNESTSGNVIQWIVNDSDPDSFILYQNGSVYQTGTWDGSELEFNIDGLSPGHWNFTLVVFDDTDMTASDSVIVHVRTAELSFDTLILYVSIFGVEVAAVLGIVFFLRRRRLKSKLEKTQSLDSEDALTPLLEDAQQET